MTRLRVAVLLSILVCAGCDSGRLDRLEKENQDLKAQMERGNASQQLELQSKCSNDARAWFQRNFQPPPKETILLDFTNHYNKAQNKCFVSVENHFHTGTGSSWANDVTVYDVYENAKLGEVIESHLWNYIGKWEDSLVECAMYGQQCKSLDDFNKLSAPAMNN